LTLGTDITKAVIFDRDYRSDSEVDDVLKDLRRFCCLAFIHKRKEIENYLLEPSAIERAIIRRIIENHKRGGKASKFNTDGSEMLLGITNPLRNKVSGQYLAKRAIYEKLKNPGLDPATINERIMSEFDTLWEKLSSRLIVVPGKQVLSILNQRLQ